MATAPRGGKTREQILEAARQALIQEGYERITTRRIAQEAGVNIATLHYHFKTKEILLTEAVRFGIQQSVERLQAVILGAPDVPSALRQVFNTIWNRVRERPGIMRYDLAVRGFRDPEARREAAAIYQTYHDLMVTIFDQHKNAGGTFAPGITVQMLSHYVIAAVDGVILQYTITDNDDEAHNSLQLIEQHVLTLMNANDNQNDSKNEQPK